MSPLLSRDLFDQLRKVLNLPETCVSLSIRMAKDDVATVFAEFYAQGDAKAAVGVFGNYVLVRREPSDASAPDPSQSEPRA